MTLSIRSRLRTLSLGTSLGATLFALAACGPKDADIKSAVDKAVAGVPGITVSVNKGVATIAGQFASDSAKTATEALVKGVAGVTSVLDSATVMPPAPPPAPVAISPDDSLKTTVTAALAAYPTLVADVKDGVVTLTGEVAKADLPKAMQALSALHPKKIQNNAKILK